MTEPPSGIWKAAVKYIQTLVPFYLRLSGKAVSSKKDTGTVCLQNQQDDQETFTLFSHSRGYFCKHMAWSLWCILFLFFLPFFLFLSFLFFLFFTQFFIFPPPFVLSFCSGLFFKLCLLMVQISSFLYRKIPIVECGGNVTCTTSSGLNWCL